MDYIGIRGWYPESLPDRNGNINNEQRPKSAGRRQQGDGDGGTNAAPNNHGTAVPLVRQSAGIGLEDGERTPGRQENPDETCAEANSKTREKRHERHETCRTDSGCHSVPQDTPHGAALQGSHDTMCARE